MAINQKDKITDVIAVLGRIRDEYKRRINYGDTKELRKEAVKLVAEAELLARRYKNMDSAHKTIHDACARRLRPQVRNIADFDGLVDLWRRQGSTMIRDIFVAHSEYQQQRELVDQLFKAEQ